MLRRWFDLVNQNAEDIATLITWENGKPLAEARGEAAYAASFLEWYSEEATRIQGDTISASSPNRRVLTIKQPVGVCGLITPWNFPAAMLTRKIGPALAAGCTVVAKSPNETPFTANALAELSRRAGIPNGVINVITAADNTARVGNTLCESPLVRKVSFTGSTQVGKLLMQQSSGTLKKLSLELGGNAPLIVFDDCPDLDAAVEGTMASKFRSSGQTCICANRIFVQETIYDEFAKKLAEKMKSTMRVGAGFDPNTTHGPLIHAAAVEKVSRHISDAVSRGASVVCGGRRSSSSAEDDHRSHTNQSNFFPPTLLTNVSRASLIAREETFGPVAALFPFSNESDVIAAANNIDQTGTSTSTSTSTSATTSIDKTAPAPAVSDKTEIDPTDDVGLAAYIFTASLPRVWRLIDALEVGMVGVNTGLISDAAVPFGGVKMSGFGKEGGKEGIEEYLVRKSVTMGGLE